MSDRFAEFDQIADAFELEWRSGNRPKIGEWLLRVPATDQIHLATMLLPVEFEQRIKLGEHPQVLDYEFLGEALLLIVKDCLHQFFDGTVPDTPAGNRLNPPTATLVLESGSQIGP